MLPGLPIFLFHLFHTPGWEVFSQSWTCAPLYASSLVFLHLNNGTDTCFSLNTCITLSLLPISGQKHFFIIIPLVHWTSNIQILVVLKLNSLVKKNYEIKFGMLKSFSSFPFNSLSILQLFAVAAPALVFLRF